MFECIPISRFMLWEPFSIVDLISFLRCRLFLSRSRKLDRLFSVLLSLHRGTTRHGEWVLACLQGAWPGLLGERLAAVCRPARLEKSELVVEILNRDWEEAIKSVQPVLLEKLGTVTLGEIRSLSFCRQSAVIGR
jgi:hypothetical protein